MCPSQGLPVHTWARRCHQKTSPPGRLTKRPPPSLMPGARVGGGAVEAGEVPELPLRVPRSLGLRCAVLVVVTH